MIKNHKGFTIVELIVTMAILGILMSIAIPSVKYYSNQTKKVESSSTATSLYKIVSNKVLDSKNEDLTVVFSESENPYTFSDIGLDYTNLYFMYSDNVNNFDVASIPESNKSYWVVVLPVYDTTSYHYDFTQSILIYEPNQTNRYVNGALSN